MAKILVVDDEPAILNFFDIVIRKFTNHETLLASSTEEAKDKFSDDIALVIADYEIGDDRGTKLIHQLRDCRPELPAIVISASVGLIPKEIITELRVKVYEKLELALDAKQIADIIGEAL